jgi:hypothetical protein
MQLHLPEDDCTDIQKFALKNHIAKQFHGINSAKAGERPSQRMAFSSSPGKCHLFK